MSVSFEEVIEATVNKVVERAVAQSLARAVLPLPNRYLDLKEAAAYLGLEYHNFSRDVKKGRIDIPTIRMKQRIIRFDIRDLDEFMETLKALAGQPEGVVG